MHTIYKAVPFEDVERILQYCHQHSVKNGGLFEVYPSPDSTMEMVIVNSCSEDAEENERRPLGAFYCNFSGPGVISIEDEDPHYDGSQSRKRHVQAIKQIIDILLQQGYPGTQIQFNDLPALKGTSKN